MDAEELRRLASYAEPSPASTALEDAAEEIERMRLRIRELEHLARLSGDFRDQIHYDVEWDRVPPWTMRVVRALDEALAAFDEEDDRR